MNRFLCALLVCCFCCAAVSEAEPLVRQKGILELDDQFNTPDGMTVDKAGNIILAIPNAHAREGGTWLLKVSPENNVEKYFWLKPHPETNKACPLGIVFGDDGNLYICDGQGIGGDTTHKSRILRVVHENGKPVREETLVTGIVQANGIDFANGKIYCAETQFPEEIKSMPLESGVFCFDLKEFGNDAKLPIHVGANGNDPHCIYKFTTNNKDWPIGANGIGLSNDKKKVYVANFGEQSIIELTLDETGKKVVADRVCVKGGPIESVDGLKICPSGYIFFADFAGNAVLVANPANGKIVLLAKDAPGGTGANGELDRCSEVCIRGFNIYVSNIDLPFGNKNDKPHSVSIIDLKPVHDKMVEQLQ